MRLVGTPACKQPPVQRGGSRRRTRRQRGGDPSPCSNNTNYAPYEYDSFNRWRGNAGDSIPIAGATVPMNPLQRATNWFNGKSTLFTPSAFDSTSQTKVQYQSQNTNQSPQSLPSLSTLKAQRPDMYGKLQSYLPFNTVGDDLSLGVSQMTPMARAGGASRRRRRQVGTRQKRKLQKRRR